MIQSIRKSKTSKVIACYLAIQMLIQIAQPNTLWALTSGPSQPEFNSFTPIGTSDMVNLSSGDFNYNIPIMDVGGYPLNLAYDAGVTMDQEASWVGLGWNLNVGQINRQVRGIPDDFKGDEIRYENNMEENRTYGAVFGSGVYVFGAGDFLGLKYGLGVQHNNYTGFSFMPSVGLTFNLHDNVSLGFNIQGSNTSGANISPSLSLSKPLGESNNHNLNMGASFGVSYNSRQGLSSMSLSTSASASKKVMLDGEKVKSGRGGAGLSLGRSFVNNTYTPTKRVGYANFSGSVKAAVGGEFFGLEGQVDLEGYVNFQKIKKDEKDKTEKAYGYQFTELASNQDILDFNREKDRAVTEVTKVLPVTNYTYDLYSVNGQGIAGQFRPYRSQIGYVFDPEVSDVGDGGDLAAEFGAGNLVHVGVDIRRNTSNSSTGLWKNRNTALPHFQEKTKGNRIDYRKTYFKMIGEMNIDNEIASDNTLFQDQVGMYNPVRFRLANDGSSFKAVNAYEQFQQSQKVSTNANVQDAINRPLKREGRVLTNTNVQALTTKEVFETGNGFLKRLLGNTNSFSNAHIERRAHHTAAIKILKNDGSRYIYGKAAYNLTKEETTFNISGNKGDNDGLVQYRPNIDNNPRKNKRGNHYFNRITTPEYAHTYLLTSVLSADYEDLTNDGPSDDDLGAYTKFTYQNLEPNNSAFKWRTPYQENKASYNEGLKSDATDDMGNYIYGEKELLYANTIETKTHIAKFFLSPRQDAFGVKGRNGGVDTDAPLHRLDSIALYSKREYNPNSNQNEAIKTAHFEYFEEDEQVKQLCQGIPNHENYDPGKGPNDNPGKLTLKKVYFTYRDSHMGRYTPYTFTYDEESNFPYSLKNYDAWGNYKPGSNGNKINDPLSVSDFPYVAQNKEQHDRNVRAWSLKSIGLPSGGRMDIEFEADDYQYVQDQKTMQMFQVVGAGINPDPEDNKIQKTELYDKGNGVPKIIPYFYIQLNKNLDEEEKEEFYKKVLQPVENEPVYFRFLTNIRKEGIGGEGTNINNNASMDYVTGYFFLDKEKEHKFFEDESGTPYISIPVKLVGIDKDDDDAKEINPVAKAGFNFARKYLNRIAYSEVYGKDPNPGSKPGTVLKGIVKSLGSILNVFQGPNAELRQLNCARYFKSGKAWIRLGSPNDSKLGGGCRVKSLRMHDEWDAMTNQHGNELYKQFYGQEYNYSLPSGGSSGVATYEPVISKENPFVQPVFETTKHLLAPDVDNYIEKPFGESFFPSPTVTYSRVEVKNLERKDGDRMVKKHATGRVVTEFYTSYDFPTEFDYTPIDTRVKKPDNFSNPFFINEEQEMTMSQGFSIHTNDMNGKQRSQKVYAEGEAQPISGVDYLYKQKPNSAYHENPIAGKLDNTIPTIDSDGLIDKKMVGVEFDVINDFRQNSSSFESYGADTNVGTFLAAVFPVVVPLPIPTASSHKDQLKSVATTKVIHTTGIMEEKIAYDLNSKVSTKNLAWDANTGDVLVTETVNEYNDKYYNLTYPAYWGYRGMGQASQNIDTEWGIEKSGNKFRLINGKRASDIFVKGDELEVLESYEENEWVRYWIAEVDPASNTVDLMDYQGYVLSKRPNEEMQLPNGYDHYPFKIMRSGLRNQQSASMASLTLMKDPVFIDPEQEEPRDELPEFTTTDWDMYHIVNTSAVEYSDLWASQCEVGLPEVSSDAAEISCINPYRYNIKGDWRAKRSYAYLTGRKFEDMPELQKDGFLADYAPLYTKPSNTDQEWVFHDEKVEDGTWTFASEVTQYSPFGAELENKDALDRYSSARYNSRDYTLPVAVASNSKFRNMAVTSFETNEIVPRTNRGKTRGFRFDTKINDWEDDTPVVRPHTGNSTAFVSPGGVLSYKARLVDCPNSKPEAEDDEVTIISGRSITIPILQNDNLGNDATGASISIISEPAIGEIVLNNNNTPDTILDDYFVYSSDENYQGIQKVIYEICDNSCTPDGKGDCDTAEVTINIEYEPCNSQFCTEPRCDCDPFGGVKITSNLVWVPYENLNGINEEWCIGRKSIIPISGKPNQTVSYIVGFNYLDRDGCTGIIDGKEVINSKGKSSHIGSINLDATGNGTIRFDLGIARKSGRNNEYARVYFRLLGQNNSRFDEIVFDINSWLRRCFDRNTPGNYINYETYEMDCPNYPQGPCKQS